MEKRGCGEWMGHPCHSNALTLRVHDNSQSEHAINSRSPAPRFHFCPRPLLPLDTYTRLVPCHNWATFSPGASQPCACPPPCNRLPLPARSCLRNNRPASCNAPPPWGLFGEALCTQHTLLATFLGFLSAFHTCQLSLSRYPAGRTALESSVQHRKLERFNCPCGAIECTGTPVCTTQPLIQTCASLLRWARRC